MNIVHLYISDNSGTKNSISNSYIYLSSQIINKFVGRYNLSTTITENSPNGILSIEREKTAFIYRHTEIKTKNSAVTSRQKMSLLLDLIKSCYLTGYPWHLRAAVLKAEGCSVRPCHRETLPRRDLALLRT